jgi:nitroreductase
MMLGMFNEAQIRQIVEAAGKAPSIHNSQPWEFAVAGDT